MQIFSRLLGKHWGRLLKQSKLQNLVVMMISDEVLSDLEMKIDSPRALQF